MREDLRVGETRPGDGAARAASRVAANGGLPPARHESLRLEQLEGRIAQLEAQLGASGADSAARREVLVLPRTVLLVLAIAAAAALCVAFVYFAWQAISLVLLAALAAVALNPGVEFFIRRGWRRGYAATAVFVCGFLFVAAGISLVLPALIDQISRFAAAMPALAKGQGPLGFLERKYQVVEHVQHALTASDSALNILLGIAGTAISGVAIAFLTFFMLLEGPVWVERLLGLAPRDVRPRVERVANGVSRAVSGFVTGNVLTAALAGVVAAITLYLAGVPYAVPLGLFVAILDLLPIVGPVLILVLVGVVALTKGVLPTIVVVGVLFVYHQIEIYYLRPVIYGRTIELSPLAVLVTVIVGTEIAGLPGALAAIPIAGSLQVVAAEIIDARACARRGTIVAPRSAGG